MDLVKLEIKNLPFKMQAFLDSLYDIFIFTSSG